MHRRGLAEKAAGLKPQRRWYLNLYPKPDVDTMQPFSNSMMYYGLPDYTQHKDNKQLRPAKLDETNTAEMTREEERIQRIKLMNHRKTLERNSRRASSVERDLPTWEETNQDGKGRYKRTWSGAQTVEYFLRRNVTPVELDTSSDVGCVDPHGVLSSPDPINAAWELTPAYRPIATSFKQLISPVTFAELQTRYTALSKVSNIPATGLDFIEITKNLSSGIMANAGSGSGLMTYRRSAEWLADFSETLSSGALVDDVFQQLAAVARLEASIDVFSSEWNHCIADDDEIGEESFTKLVEGYKSNAGFGFWKAFSELSESKTEFSVFLDNKLELTNDELKTTIQNAAESIVKLGEVLERKYEKMLNTGEAPPSYLATSEDWISVAEKLVLSPFKDWAKTGEPFPEWDDEDKDAIQTILDEQISGKITAGEWLRWEFLSQFTFPMKIHETNDRGPVQPFAMLAARFKNMTFRSVFKSLSQDHSAHALARLSLFAKPDPEKPGLAFFQFLRMVCNGSNIQNYNSQMSRAFLMSSTAAGKYLETGELSVPSVPPGDLSVYDRNSIIAELFTKTANRDWTTTESASSAREAVRRDTQAVAYLTTLKSFQPYLRTQQKSLAMVKWAAQDVHHCIGHLRRKITLKISEEESPAKVENVAVTNISDKPWVCGSTKQVTWKWIPEPGYEVKLASKEQKEHTFTQIVNNRKSTADGWSTESMIQEVMAKVDSYDAAVSTPDTERHEWAFTKMYHKWKREQDEEKMRADVQIEHRYKVHVGLYKKNTSKLENLQKKRELIRDFQKSAGEASESSETRRLSIIIDKARDWAVNSFVESIQHNSGVARVETELLQAITNGELQKLIDGDTHLTETEAEKAGELWDLQFDLNEDLTGTCSNTGSHRVRLPFTRDGVKLDPSAVYRVEVAGIVKNERVGSEASEEFKILDNLSTKLDEFVKNGRQGRPALLGSERNLLPAKEVQDAIDFVKAESGIEFDLQRETRIGSDIIVHTAHGTTHTPVVHVSVLLDSMKADHHREELLADPVKRFITRHDAGKKKAWEASHPAATNREWDAVKSDILSNGKNDQWWSHDTELEWGPDGFDTGSNPLANHLDLKFANLYTNHSTRLAKLRYEGSGLVSDLSLASGLPRIRVPLTSSGLEESECCFKTTLPDPATELPVRTSVKVFVNAENRLMVEVEGTDPEVVAAVDFNEKRWEITMGRVTVKLPQGFEGEHVVSDVKRLAKQTGISTAIPEAISLRPHHIAEICKEAINGAHTLHASHAAAFKTTHVPRRHTPTVDDVIHFPTAIQAWQEASVDIPSPTGIEVQRRRFDSWQLNSGKGRYDHSPTKNETWQHPIEENPNVYGYQDLQPTMRSL
eukprot:TRINITY_DN22459_c0_g1_i1.p1 TRINITY_DN22459_c0_g1~~TRINITY_DN22459_c0_g1_i1.p1  ORF type:complete len:1363 (+),score=302.70 TRINITY_DN22459_c0_g1_i1:36-4124(+)